MSKRTWLCGTALALILAGSPRPAAAEWFFDLYGGAAFTKDADITIRDGATLDTTLKFDTEATGGGRFGYWLTGIGIPWLGFSADVSYYAPATSAADVDARLEVVPISGLVLLRLPLMPDPEVPTGRIQPYIGGGPSLVATRVKVDAPAIGERFSGRFVPASFAWIPVSAAVNFGVREAAISSPRPGAASFGVDLDSTFQALGGLTLRF